MKKADEIINAGDPDDEGQLLIDELIKYFNYRGPVKRVLINDNLPDKIRQAFAGLSIDDFIRLLHKTSYLSCPFLLA